MDLNDYQNKAIATAVYPLQERIVYPSLGLAGETGEFCNKIKKAMRGDYKLDDPSSPEVLAVIEELGDVLWYVANVAHDLKWDLGSVAEANLNKTERRLREGTIRGSGDER